MIWMEEDGAGGWTRLETKLSMNNLHFLGSSIPSTLSAIPGCMQDLADSCKTLGRNSFILHIFSPLLYYFVGLPDAIALKKPLSFTKLIAELERLLLIKPSSVSSVSKKSSKESSKESSLSNEHHAEVWGFLIFICKELK